MNYYEAVIRVSGVTKLDELRLPESLLLDVIGLAYNRYTPKTVLATAILRDGFYTDGAFSLYAEKCRN